MTEDCKNCERYERPPQVCNLCRKGRIVKLNIRMAKLEDVLRETRKRLAGMNRTTAAIDYVLE